MRAALQFPISHISSQFSLHHFFPQFDLDDTLYINEHVPEFVRKMIIDYIETHLGLNITHEEAVAMCMKFYLESGTTLAGLCSHGHSIDFDHWYEKHTQSQTLPLNQTLPDDLIHPRSLFAHTS